MKIINEHKTIKIVKIKILICYKVINHHLLNCKHRY